MPYIKPKKQECPRCGKRFTTNRDLSLHLQRKKPCEPTKTPILASTLFHCATHSEPLLQTCTGCQRNFSRQGLRDHLLHERCIARWLWHFGDISTFTAATGSFPTFQQWRSVWTAQLFALMFEHDGATIMIKDVMVLEYKENTPSIITVKSDTALMISTQQTPPPFRQAVIQRTATPQPLEVHRERITVTNEDCLHAIQSASELSAESKSHYVGCLKRIISGGSGNGSQATPALIPKTSILWCVSHPKETCKLLQTALSNAGMLNARNMHNYMTSLRSVLKHHPQLAKLTAIRQQWTKLAETLCVQPLAAQAKDNQPSERQQKGFVTYQEIAAKFKELCEKDLGSRESLLVGLVGLGDEKVMPQRRDFGMVKLCIGRRPNSKEAKGNYLVISQSSDGHFSAFIALNRYKTAKTYGEQQIQLPHCYIRTLLASLERDPRDWLFTKRPDKNTAKNQPYDKANGFGKMANKMLEKQFDRALTLTGCRHSFITQMHCSSYWASLSDAQREDIAHQMGHSFNTACRYRFINQSTT